MLIPNEIVEIIHEFSLYESRYKLALSFCENTTIEFRKELQNEIYRIPFYNLNNIIEIWHITKNLYKIDRDKKKISWIKWRNKSEKK